MYLDVIENDLKEKISTAGAKLSITEIKNRFKSKKDILKILKKKFLI